MRTFVAVISLCVLAVANVEAIRKETLNLTPLVDFTDVYNRHEEMQKLVDTSAQDDSRNWTNSDRINKGPNTDNQYNSGQQHSPGSPSKPSSPGVPGHPPSGNPHTPEKPSIPNFPPTISYPSTGNPNYPNNEYPNFQYPPGGYPNYPAPTINPGYPSTSGYPIYSPPGYPFYPPYQGYPPCYCHKMQ